ncbi:MAG: TolC family protein [bacterium]|nr:TolC family protein [bacterium]
MKRFILVLVVSVLLCGFSVVEGADKTGLKLIQAVKSSLQNNQDIKVGEMTVLTGKGVYQATRGTFDPTLSLSFYRVFGYPGYPTSGTDLDELKSIDSMFSLSLTKEFRSGISTTLTAAPTQYRSYGVDIYNTSDISFELTVPLLQGRGKSSTGATEKAYKLLYEGYKLSLQNTVAGYLKQSAQGYWNYVAAVKTLNLYLKAKEESEKHLAEIVDLKKSNKKFEKVSIGQLEANTRSQDGQGLDAVQTVRMARQSLGIIMGLPYKELDALPVPVTDFPTIEFSRIKEVIANLQRYVDNALAKRADLKAYEKNIRSGEVLLKQAKNQTLNQLDLSATVGYIGYNTAESGVADYFSSMWENRSGMNSTLGLTYVLPIKNNANRGALVQTRAALKTYELQKFQLKRSISSQINLSISNLKYLFLELQQIKAAEAEYEKELAIEKKKFEKEKTTLIDIVTTDSILLGSRVQLVAKQNQIAQEIVNFRYLTATLIAIDQSGGYSVSGERLTTLPSLN